MAQLLIAYDTTEGQTRKIAQYMGEVASRSGHEVKVIDIRRPPAGFSLVGVDAVLVGGSVHMGKHSRRLVVFVRRHLDGLKALPAGFFSVSLSAAGSEKEKDDARRYLAEFLGQAGWSPAVTATFGGGGLLYREYGLLKRWIMKRIARDAGKETETSTNHEYTDWQAVDQFVRGFLAHLQQPQAEGGPGSYEPAKTDPTSPTG